MAVGIASALIGAIVFAAAATGGIFAAKAMLPGLHRFDDAPPSVDFPPAALIGGAAVIGAVMAARTPPMALLVIGAIAMAGLVATWYSDSKTGIIPDVFTLVPLGIVIAYGFTQHQWIPLLSAVVMFIPFAILAAISKGRGMGWGDAKLAALGGALLGAGMAVYALALASLVAALVAWLKYRKRNAPIAMGPYLVAAIAACLPFTF